MAGPLDKRGVASVLVQGFGLVASLAMLERRAKSRRESVTITFASDRWRVEIFAGRTVQATASAPTLAEAVRLAIQRRD